MQDASVFEQVLAALFTWYIGIPAVLILVVVICVIIGVILRRSERGLTGGKKSWKYIAAGLDEEDKE